MTQISKIKLRVAINRLRQGGIIAYPTEAVYGLGCDPLNKQAVFRLLRLKLRSVDKGLILIASSFDQLLPYIELSKIERLVDIQETWPGPVTWVFPAQKWVPRLLRGCYDTLAVRVTAHPLASALANGFGKPLVSTSANPTGFYPARNALKTRKYFPKSEVYLFPGAVGSEKRTTSIFSALDHSRIR